MDFIKKNWEKVLLGVVLVGLAVAVAFLPIKISSEKEELKATSEAILNPQVKPLEPLDMSQADATLKRFSTPLTLDFSTDHRLFNPVLWQKTPDGRSIKVQTGREIGPSAVAIIKTLPLFTIITFDNVITNDASPRYTLGIERQAAEKPKDRPKKSSNEPKTDFYTVTRVNGAPNSPTELILTLADSQAQVSVSRGKPFKRVDGYMADLKYPPENRALGVKRVGDLIVIAGEQYKIIAITENEVVMSATRSQKNTTIKLADSAR